MNILCVGDVCGSIGCDFALRALPLIKHKEHIDCCIVNGENSADGNGITGSSADALFAAGADVITGGNHTLKRREIFSRLDSDPSMTRPHNMTADAGSGYAVCDLGFTRVAVINLIGRVYMPEAGDPFSAADRLVEKAKSDGIGIIVVDFHAEATSEKRVLAEYLDGRVSAVFGTHTHVATADECILKNGTGFITDIGMTGPIDSVLGVKTELSLRKIREDATVKFELADGPCRIDCVIFTINKATGKALTVKRLSVNENDLKTYGRINK